MHGVCVCNLYPCVLIYMHTLWVRDAYKTITLHSFWDFLHQRKLRAEKEVENFLAGVSQPFPISLWALLSPIIFRYNAHTHTHTHSHSKGDRRIWRNGGSRVFGNLKWIERRRKEEKIEKGKKPSFGFVKLWGALVVWLCVLVSGSRWLVMVWC